MQDNDDELFYTTSQAAAEWGVSQQRVVDLCKAGLIECEITQGGHYRIPDRVVQKYKTSGLPRLPRRLPPANGKRHLHSESGRHDLLAPPSANLVASREQRLISEHEKTISENEVTIARNKAAKLQAEWGLQEAQDKFVQRDQAMARQATELEQKQERIAWTREWIKYAVDSIPDGARGEYELAVVKGVRAQLAAMDLNDDDSVVRSVIDTIVRQILDDWYWRRDALKAIDAARDTLPWRLKGWTSEPSEWDTNARQAGASAIDKAVAKAGGVHLPYREMEKIAVAAVKRLLEEDAAEESDRRAANEDMELRRSVKADLTRSICSRLSSDDNADLGEAVDAQFAQLPRGTRRNRLEEACRQAMAPWSQPLVQADERQRQREEQDRRRRMREDVIWNAITFKFPFGFPDAKKQTAIAAVRKALEQADPEDRRSADQICDQVLKPYLDAHDRQQAAEQRANSYVEVSGVYRLVEELEQKGDIEPASFNENWAVAEQLVKRIRPVLVNVLLANPQLTDEQIRRRVDRLVDRYLDECLDSGSVKA